MPSTSTWSLNHLGPRLALAVVRVVAWLPWPVVHQGGLWLGRVLHALAPSRRRVAHKNLALCFPNLTEQARVALVRKHFAWLGRSILERAWLWHASEKKLRALIHVEGDVLLASRMQTEQGRPTMWLVPHFMALEVAAVAVQLFQPQRGGTVYQAQSNPVFDAAMRQGRERFGRSVLFSRHDGVKQLVRTIRQEKLGFFNLPDMDFGLKDAAFVPFFGQPAATLLAPSRMARMLNMAVQPVVACMTPQGWTVRFHDAWTDWPSDDTVADATRMNRWIEERIGEMPEQYLWVHKRFKTRPDGEPPVYGDA
jgi:Kdo2-lipid IVA lauroyltransferase/acyltransferase